MRKHAEWMAQSDDRILELLREDGPLKGWEIRQALARAGVDLRYPAQYLDYRCAALLTHGLIEEETTGRYRLASPGESYLDGQLDVATLDGDDDPRASDSTEFIV